MDEVLAFVQQVVAAEALVEKATLTEPSDKVFEKHARAWDAMFAETARPGRTREPHARSYYKAKAQVAEAKLINPRTIFALGRYKKLYRAWLGTPLRGEGGVEGMPLCWFIEDLQVVARYRACSSCLGAPKKCSICKSSNWTHSSGARCLKTIGKLLEVRTFGPPTNPKFLPAYQAIAI